MPPVPPAPDTPPPGPASGLPWGTEWELIDVPAADVAAADVPAADSTAADSAAADSAAAAVTWSAVRVTLGLQQERAGGRSGVNRYVGMCRDLGDGGIELGPFGMTMMAGPPEAMAAEQAYLALLERARGYRTGPDRLVLLDAGGAELLVFQPSPDPS